MFFYIKNAKKLNPYGHEFILILSFIVIKREGAVIMHCVFRVIMYYLSFVKKF